MLFNDYAEHFVRKDKHCHDCGAEFTVINEDLSDCDQLYVGCSGCGNQHTLAHRN